MQYSKKLLSLLALTALSTSAATLSANAAGFYIQEQSVKGLGAAFSGSTTSIDDASTVYFNPAGMTKLDRPQINAGVNLIIPNADIDNTGTTVPAGNTLVSKDNPYDPTPVPNLYAVAPINDQIWVGLGVSAPFGLGSDYGENSFNRYDSTETELKTINVQPSIAYKATDWFAIGGGIDIQYADAELKSTVTNGGGTGINTLQGDDINVGYNIGVLVKPIESTEIGLHYRSSVSHKLDGKIKIEGLAAGNFDIPGSANLVLPDIATLGVAHDINDQWRVMGQATYFGWNKFEEIRAVSDNGTVNSATTQDYDNTMAFAIGAEYAHNDKLTLRAGYQFDETPTTDQFRTTRTPDGDRNWFSGGATYKLKDNVELDFAATYIDVDKGTINVSRNGGLSNVKADTDGYVAIVAAGLSYKF